MSVRGGALRSGGSVALLALLLLLAPLALFPSGGPPGAPHASTTVGPSRAGALGTAGPRVGQANTCPHQHNYG